MRLPRDEARGGIGAPATRRRLLARDSSVISQEFSSLYSAELPRSAPRAPKARSGDCPAIVFANNADVLRSTALACGGIILVPTFLIGDDLRAGRLVRLLSNYPPPEQALHALYPPGRHLSVKVRTFVDFLVARFGGEPTWDRS